MKTMTEEMKSYLIKGMNEEREKDTDRYDMENIARQHQGMYHETIDNVGKYLSAVKAGDEKKADFMYEVLEQHYSWWKDYFDISPKVAHAKEEAKRREYCRRAEAKLKNYDDEVMKAFKEM